MSDQTINVLSTYIASAILKQPRRKLAADTVLISSGLIDSFSLVDLALFVEENFHVQVHDTELNAETFDTLGQLAALVEARQNHSGGR